MSYKDRYIKYKKKYLDLKNKLACTSNGKKLYTVNIGTFDQVSDKMIITDPTYEYVPEEHVIGSKLMKLNLVIDNVLPRKWNVILQIKSDQKDRNAILLVVHESYTNAVLFGNLQWLKLDGIIGVDSGSAGVYDLQFYPKTITDKWMDLNYNLVDKPTDYAGVLTHGAVSTSGFGDGMYESYIVKNDKSKIVAVKIIFI